MTSSHPSPDGISERVDALEVLAKAATPGPRRSMRAGNQYIGTGYMPTAKCVGASVVEGLVRPWNPHAALAHGLPAKGHEVVRFLDADADFIAACDPQTILALCTLVRGASEDRARLDALEAMAKDRAPGYRWNVLGNGEVQLFNPISHTAFRTHSNLRDAIDAARTPNQDSPNGR